MCAVKLHSLPKIKGSKHRTKRLGCGPGSGHGKTCGKGHKGGKARSGYSLNPLFEGGQMPMYRRFPHRGFNNFNFRKLVGKVNLWALNDLGIDVIDPNVLIEKGLIKNKDYLVKVLATGEISKPIQVKAHAFSEAAKKKIEAAGGSVQLVGSAD